MRKIPDRLMPHKNTSFRNFTGSGAKSRSYDPSVPVKRAQVVQKTKLVRNKDGAEVISSTQVYTDAIYVINLDSLYKVHAGTPFQAESTVIAVDHYDDPLVQPYLVIYLE